MFLKSLSFFFHYLSFSCLYFSMYPLFRWTIFCFLQRPPRRRWLRYTRTLATPLDHSVATALHPCDSASLWWLLEIIYWMLSIALTNTGIQHTENRRKRSSTLCFTFRLVMYKNESPSLFIEGHCEWIQTLYRIWNLWNSSPSFINLATFKVSFSYTVWRLWFTALPLGQIYAMCMPRQKLLPKTQWEKTVGEKSTSHALLMLHLSPR